MADITMCWEPKKRHCPKREMCYRSNAIPNEYWQSYCTFIYDEKTGECEGYWERE